MPSGSVATRDVTGRPSVLSTERLPSGATPCGPPFSLSVSGGPTAWTSEPSVTPTDLGLGLGLSLPPTLSLGATPESLKFLSFCPPDVSLSLAIVDVG